MHLLNRDVNSAIDCLRRMGATVGASKRIWSPLGEPVMMVEFEGLHDTRTLKCCSQDFIRRLDRFFIPEPPDPLIDTALCEYIARSYNSLVNTEVNLRNITELMIWSLTRLPSELESLTILDFGCGTGLSLQALTSLGGLGKRVRIVGTDSSPAMLEQSKNAGMEVVGFQDWFDLPEGSFDAVIASFVLHFGLTDREVQKIASQLRRRGCFVGNYHHGSVDQLAFVRQQFWEVGFTVELKNPLSSNPIVICSY